jgi:hypothetical protein
MILRSYFAKLPLAKIASTIDRTLINEVRLADFTILMSHYFVYRPLEITAFILILAVVSQPLNKVAEVFVNGHGLVPLSAEVALKPSIFLDLYFACLTHDLLMATAALNGVARNSSNVEAKTASHFSYQVRNHRDIPC